MNASLTRSFGLSAMLHAAVIIVIAYIAIPHIALSPASSTSSVFTLMPAADFSAPSTPASAVKFTPLITPTPTSPVRVESRNDSTSPRQPVAATTRPSANPKPSPAATPHRTTIDDYRRNHPEKTAAHNTPANTRPAPAVSRISADWSIATTENASAISSTLPAESSEIPSGLIQALREAYAAASTTAEGLSTSVRFALKLDGTVAFAKIVKSSGNADFDHNVLDAFTRLRLPEVPPSLCGTPLEINFRSQTLP